MLCKKTIWVEKQGRHVPCGQCMPCRINKGRLWSARILAEESMHPLQVWFVTLTYDDKHVPRTPDGHLTLRKRKTLRWLHNQKRDVGSFRYYAVGEYGDLTRRPHYHLALFPGQPAQVNQLTAAWQEFGHTSAYPLNPARARYLANYTTKKLTKDTDERLERGQEPEFRTSSRNPPIGAAFIPPLVSAYRTRRGQQIIEERGDIERTLRIGGKVYPLAPYLLNKARERLGIPLLHRDRIDANANYLDWHIEQEMLPCPEEADAQEVFLNAEKIRKTYRTPHEKL